MDKIEIYNNIDFESDFDFLSNTLKEIDNYFDGFVARGSLGLWNGTRLGYKFLNKLEEVYSFLEDYTKIVVNFKTGMVEIQTIHHDGTNIFKIKGISKRGFDFFNNHYYDFSDFDLCQKIFDTKGLTKKITKKIFEGV